MGGKMSVLHELMLIEAAGGVKFADPSLSGRLARITFVLLLESSKNGIQLSRY